MNYLEDFAELLDMLTYARPAGSQIEEDWVARFIDPLNPFVDAYGNRYIWVMHPDHTIPTTMFTAHTDSVHRVGSKSANIVLDAENGYVSCGQDNSCLGADDAAGVYIMKHMIQHKIPGLYCFFRAEEVGGLGSTYFHKNLRAVWGDIRACISFDRNSLSNDVVSSQGWGRCCSDKFAYALSDELSMYTNLHYKPSDKGIFTDSANFMDDIPECTNISCGYVMEHTRNETLDLNILKRVMDAVIEIDWEALPNERDPEEDSYDLPWFDYTGTDKDPSTLESVKWVVTDPDFVLTHIDEFCRDEKIPTVMDEISALIWEHLVTNGSSGHKLERWYDRKLEGSSQGFTS